MDRKRTHSLWCLLLSAAAILAITMGIRQSLGLFIHPIHHDTGIDLVSISFALAVGQLMWGVAQPIFGAIADTVGSMTVIVSGGLMMAAGLALTPLISDAWWLTLTVGILTCTGAGAGAFSILIGATARHIPADKQSTASGFINAGGSFGQFIYAPLTQGLLNLMGWVSTLWALALSVLATLPLGKVISAPATESRTSSTRGELAATLRKSLKNKNYICLHIGFFTCGFHVAFLTTHLPGEVAACGIPEHVASTSLALIGLFNIAGSLGAGWLGTKIRMKYILAGLYASRALMILIFMASPKTPASFYVFALFLGLTWLATVPPTSGLVGKTFGVRYLATLFGLTLLSHQVGGFLGAFLGGWFMQHNGSYTIPFIIDCVLALLAAVSNLPIEEKKLAR